MGTLAKWVESYSHSSTCYEMLQPSNSARAMPGDKHVITSCVQHTLRRLACNGAFELGHMESFVKVCRKRSQDPKEADVQC